MKQLHEDKDVEVNYYIDYKSGHYTDGTVTVKLADHQRERLLENVKISLLDGYDVLTRERAILGVYDVYILLVSNILQQELDRARDTFGEMLAAHYRLTEGLEVEDPVEVEEIPDETVGEWLFYHGEIVMDYPRELMEEALAQLEAEAP